MQTVGSGQQQQGGGQQQQQTQPQRQQPAVGNQQTPAPNTQTPQPRNAQGQFQSPQQNQQPAAQGGGQMTGPPDPDLIYDDPQEYQRQMQQWQQQTVQAAQQQVAQQLQPMLQNQGEQAKLTVKRDPEYQDVFDEYEPEIVAEMQNINPAQRTVKAWQTAAEIVAGRHRKELGQKYAQQAQPEPSPTARQGGAPAGADKSYRDAIDELLDSDHQYAQYCHDKDVTAEDLRRRASEMDLSPEEFVEIVKRGNMVTSVSGIEVTD